MAETDVLNPNPGYDRTLGDSPNPNFGWQQSRAESMARAKAAFGTPYARETSNAGVTYRLNFTRRNRKVMEYLKQFAAQHEQGFFTLVDHDGGREYVGRFVGELPVTLEANGRWSMSGWSFEEVPGAPMRTYPAEWDRWAIDARPIDDFGGWNAAAFASVANAWSQPDAVVGDDGVARAPKQLQNLAEVTAGDWVAQEYRGYGFRLWANQGPGYGKINVSIDGGAAVLVDLYAAAELGPQIVLEQVALPLDVHRVKVTLPGTKNAAATGLGMVWDKLEVMR